MKKGALIFTLLLAACTKLYGQKDSVDFDNYGHCLFGKVNNYEQALTTPPWSSANWWEEDEKTYIIPLVVHIVYSNTLLGAYRVTDADVINTIQILNEDYGKYGIYNKNSLGVDSKIRFCLASLDDEGRPALGITRTKSPYGKINTENEYALKSLIRWNSLHYFNIWVVDQIEGSDNLAGYAYLASQMSNKDSSRWNDGVVINYKFFVRNASYNLYHYNLARTLTHETGHYLDLLHPWGNDNPQTYRPCIDDDGVDDTPPCNYRYSSDFTPPADTCKHPYQCGRLRQVENFMDYSHDFCMNTFTQGQVTRMRRAIRLYRPNLIAYPNLTYTGCSQLWEDSNAITQNRIDIYPNPSTTSIKLYFFLKQKSEITYSIYDATGRCLKANDKIIANTGLYTLHQPALSAGLYYIILKTGDEIFNKKLIISQQ